MTGKAKNRTKSFLCPVFCFYDHSMLHKLTVCAEEAEIFGHARQGREKVGQVGTYGGDAQVEIEFELEIAPRQRTALQLF